MIRRRLANSPRRGERVLAALDHVAGQTGSSLAQIALAWTMHRPGITGVIASATSLEQFGDLAAATELNLDVVARQTPHEASSFVAPRSECA